MRRDRQRHRPGQCGRLYLAAENRLFDRNWQFHSQIEAFALENRVRGDMDGDERVSRRPTVLARRALTSEPDLLPILDAGGDARFELASVGEDDTPRAPEPGFAQGNRGLELNIGPLPRLCASPAATAKTAKEVGEDVVGLHTLRPIGTAPMEIEALRPARATPRAKSLEALFKSAGTRSAPGMEAL